MFYKNFVVAVKTGGKILKDIKGEVFLPFKSEYSLILKNLNSVGACARVTIDGRDTLDGGRIIIPPNSTVELERFLDGSNHSGHRFKFIEMTDKIADHRGETLDDGLVRVEYWFEQQVNTTWSVYYADNTYRGNGGTTSMPFNSGPHWTYTSSVTSKGLGTPRFCSATADAGPVTASASAPATMGWMDEPAAGITVNGARSNQQFAQGSLGPLETQSNVITLKLSGEQGVAKVIKPVTRVSTITCPVCGNSCKAWYDFCNECGNNLH